MHTIYSDHQMQIFAAFTHSSSIIF